MMCSRLNQGLRRGARKVASKTDSSQNGERLGSTRLTRDIVSMEAKWHLTNRISSYDVT